MLTLPDVFDRNSWENVRTTVNASNATLNKTHDTKRDSPVTYTFIVRFKSVTSYNKYYDDSAPILVAQMFLGKKSRCWLNISNASIDTNLWSWFMPFEWFCIKTPRQYYRTKHGAAKRETRKIEQRMSSFVSTLMPQMYRRDVKERMLFFKILTN